MGTFHGTLEQADQPASRHSIEAEVTEGRLLLYSTAGKVGDWSVAEIRLARAVEGFSLLLDGVEMRLIVDDFPGFWAIVSDTQQDFVEHLEAPPEPARSQWWRFWSDDSWRTWRARRVPWVEHRQKVRSLESRIAQLRQSTEEKPDALQRDPEHDAALLQAAERQLAEAVPPPRPISPAWTLAVTAVIVAVALGAGAADLSQEDPAAPPPQISVTTTVASARPTTPSTTSAPRSASAGSASVPTQEVRTRSLGQNALLDAPLN